jgi:hypothetical protein
VISDAAFSKGDVVRQLHELQRDVQQLKAARRLEAAQIGAGGLHIRGGRLTIADAADQVVDLATLAFGQAAATVLPDEEVTSTTWSDLATVGPQISDVPIGSSRRCIVLISVSLAVTGDNAGFAAVRVSGSSSFIDTQSAAYLGHTAGISGSATSFAFLDAGKGLNEGLHNFKLEYAKFNVGGTVLFKNRTISVIPF